MFLINRFFIFLVLFHSPFGQADSLGNGWHSFTRQVDPFDKSVKKIVFIRKGKFVFYCNSVNMSGPSYGYENLSFPADIRFIVDQSEPVKRPGKYSTYHNGSDVTTDSRYFSFRPTSDDIAAFKLGSKLKMAGKWAADWTSDELDLKGFTKAYREMCG